MILQTYKDFPKVALSAAETHSVSSPLTGTDIKRGHSTTWKYPHERSDTRGRGRPQALRHLLSKPTSIHSPLHESRIPRKQVIKPCDV